MKINNESSKKTIYKWKLDQFPVYGLPMSNLPLHPLPSIPWIIKAIERLLYITSNVNKYFNVSHYDEVQKNEIKNFEERAGTLLEEYEESERQSKNGYILFSEEEKFSEFMNLMNELSLFILDAKGPDSLVKAGVDPDEKASEWGLDRYNSIFQNEPLPAVAHYLRDDRVFAYWRVAGNNPIMLRRANQLPDNFPLKNTQYQEVMGVSDSLSRALSEGRIYITDYKKLGNMINEEGVFKEKIGVTYAYAPIVLFSVAKGSNHIMPVAIQTGQDPSKHNIFLRSEKRDYFWGWQMAKYLVQVADESYHEIFTHLAYTHLISEVFAVATVRNFSKKHVLYRLLKTHFEGTTFINWGATMFLLRDNQFIDNLFSAKLENIQGETLLKRFNFDFFEMMLPNELESRGVNDSSILGEYPYRDDGMLIWNAIADWVSDYVDLYYKSDERLSKDTELRNWVADILANGKIQGFREINDRSTLKQVLTMVIFTASAQHAAVNFTQPEWMRYAPAMAATSSVIAPYSRTGRENSDWLSMLPNYDQALQKYYIYSLLGGVHHGFLGKYTEIYNSHVSVFVDARVSAPGGLLDKFRNNLATIEQQIEKRNESRLLPYSVLLPKNIPASTNI